MLIVNILILKFQLMQKLLSNIFIIIFLINISSIVNGQTLKSDDSLIIENVFNNEHFTKRDISINDFDSGKTILLLKPFKYAFNSLLFFYQKIFSAQISASCLYYPTCSEFSRLLLKEYGVFSGIIFSADRLLRCNRISATGIHPLRINKKTQKMGLCKAFRCKKRYFSTNCKNY